MISLMDTFFSDTHEIESDIASLSIRFDWFSKKAMNALMAECGYGFFQELNFVDPNGQSIPIPGHERFIGVPEPATLALLALV